MVSIYQDKNNRTTEPTTTQTSFKLADFLSSDDFNKLNYRQQLGLYGQQAAKYYLLQKKFEILAENFFTRTGEIDLVARKEQGIRIVEVKTRTSLERGQPYEAVHKYKLLSLQQSAQVFMQNKGWLGKVNFQIDVCSVFIDKIEKKVKIKYLENVS